MYQIKLINPHKQFGKYNCSMIFHDTLGELPDNRWEKKYPDSVTKNQALLDIKNTIVAWVQELNAQRALMEPPLDPITWADAKLNGASVTLDNIGGTKTLWQY